MEKTGKDLIELYRYEDEFGDKIVLIKSLLRGKVWLASESYMGLYIELGNEELTKLRDSLEKELAKPTPAEPGE